MDLKLARRMAADILGVGENAVWLDPDKSGEISAAIQRDDVRRLIREGKIAARERMTNSKGRLRKRRLQISKGRRKGQGRRKGSTRARNPRKRNWIRSIRAIRKRLSQMRDERELERSQYRKLYLMAKAGFFRSVSHLETYVAERELLRR
jgi:large subunit ribosomal protein L19e